MATIPNAKMTRARRKTDASGQALGYALQYTRLTSMLLQASEGSFCSLECLDDVAEASPRDGVKRVQTKSALTANPVADRAKSLWKTFSNWLNETSAHDFSTGPTTFEIYVSRPVEGRIVQAFHAAATTEQALAAIELARDVLWGRSPEFPARAEVSSEIAPYVDHVLSAAAESLVPIIRGFRLECGGGSPNADLEDLLRTHPIPPSKVGQVADYVCGMVKRRVDELLETNRPAILARDEFHAQYRAYLRKVDSETVLMGYARRPTAAQAMRTLPAVFVSQLDLIGLDYEDKLEAVNDYLMACADRTEWAQRGDVDASSFEDLDSTLTRTWRNRKRSLGLQHRSLQPEEQGELLYRDCLETKPQLQSMATPSYFVPGCLHRLSDELTIGWHPSYDALIKAKKAA